MGEEITVPYGEVCPACGEKPDPVSPHWRFNGTRWEHYHGYPVGHIPTELPEDDSCLTHGKTELETSSSDSTGGSDE